MKKTKNKPKRYRQPRKAINLTIVSISVLLLISGLGIAALTITNIIKPDSISQCSIKQNLNLTNDRFQSLKGELQKNQTSCLDFSAISGQSLTINSNQKLTLVTPSKDSISLQGSSKSILQNTGNYSIIINPESDTPAYEIALKLENNAIATTPTPPKPKLRLLDPYDSKQQSGNESDTVSYNVVTPPPFKKSEKLQAIVNNIISLSQSRGLPVDRLSVSLVDLNSSECCAYASHLDGEPRFPASVVKLFWMVALYGQFEAGKLTEGGEIEEKLSKMIKESHNGSASFIVDKITQTTSGDKLPPDKLKEWKEKRYSLNRFFDKAGYSPINISQKSFPLDYVKNDPPLGRDLQIRGNESTPYRNYVTTYNVARLLFEIYTQQAISKEASMKMRSLLTRDLSPETWKNHDFNPIEGFLGESLPTNTYFSSKMGWTFNNRNDSTIVVSSDNKIRYILVIFGDDASFYKDKKIYPDISRMVYENMRH